LVNNVSATITISANPSGRTKAVSPYNPSAVAKLSAINPINVHKDISATVCPCTQCLHAADNGVLPQGCF